MDKEKGMKSERLVGRHCINEWCDGPEWWDLNGNDSQKYKPCLFCGSPCSLDQIPDDLPTEKLLHALLYSHEWRVKWSI